LTEFKGGEKKGRRLAESKVGDRGTKEINRRQQTLALEARECFSFKEKKNQKKKEQ